MNLAWRDIRHNVGRFLLTCLGLSLLLGVVMSMAGIYRGLVDDALAVTWNAGADLWVVEAGTLGPFAESSRIPGDAREAVARIRGVVEAGSVTYQNAEGFHRGRKVRAFVVGYERGRPGGPRRIAEGRPIGRSHYEIVADRRAGLAIGDRLRLGRNDFTVVGLTENQSSSAGDPIVFMTLLDAQELQFELAPASARRELARGAAPAETDVVNAVLARVAPYVEAAQVAGQVRRWKHLAAMTQAEQEFVLTHSLVERARRQIGLFTATLIVVSAVIIALIVYTLTMDKIREIATLKLIGAPDRTIVGLIVQQALALGGVGFAVGAALVALVKDYYPRRVVVFETDVLALGGVVIVVCLLASAFGVRLALRVDPATALGG
jgi:putative ABC transport system permease protein